MNKQETNSNHSSGNLNQNLSPEEIDMLPSVDVEMEQLRALAFEEGAFSGQNLMRDALNGFKQITGNDLLKIIIFTLLVSIYNPYSGLWDFSSGTRHTTRITTIYNTPENPIEKDDQHANDTANKESIVKTEIVPLERRKYLDALSNTEDTGLNPENPPALVTALEGSGILNSSTIDNLNTDIINSFATKIKENSILINNEKLETDNNLVQLGNYNAKILGALPSSLLSRLREDNSVSKSEIITVKPFKGKEITLLSSFINGYLKTNMNIEKDMVIYISSNGTISTNNCNIEFKPEGWAYKSQGAICEPVLDNYKLGALLFRIGNDDNWKPYTESQTKIIAEKDGMLEFMINLKSSGKSFINGSYALGVSTGQLMINN